MNIEKLLNTIIEAGKMLVESGAEVNRVEETMVRMCRCFEGIEYADSYVTLTGIMFSLTYDNQTMTRICRVHTGEVDLNRIDQINTLSRRICSNPISVDELANELELRGCLAIHLKRQCFLVRLALLDLECSLMGLY